MSTQLSCAASLDIAHGLLLSRAKAVGLPIISIIAEENRRNFKRGFSHQSPHLSRGWLDHIRRAGELLDQSVSDVGVAQRGFDGDVPEQDLEN